MQTDTYIFAGLGLGSGLGLGFGMDPTSKSAIRTTVEDAALSIDALSICLPPNRLSCTGAILNGILMDDDCILAFPSRSVKDKHPLITEVCHSVS